MNHKYLKKLLWIILIFVSSCNDQKFIENLPEIPEVTVNQNSTPTSKPMPSVAVSPDIQKLEKSVFTQVNQYRQSQNLPRLKWDNTIAEQSRIHAQQMAGGEAPFSHDGFKERVQVISQQIRLQSAAENLANNMGYSNPGEQAVAGWIDSPGHQKNMIGDYDLTGIGIAKNSEGTYYFNQIFIKTR